MSEWKKVRLGEAAVMKRGKYITRSDTRPGNIPVILGGQEPAYYCDEANHTGPCIVISRSGASAGFVSYWQQPIFVTDGFLFEAKEQSSIHYLYYCLKANQSLLGNLQNATAIPHVRGEDLKDFEIPLPPLPTQRRVAAVLSSLDDKIENNRKICANLEAQAQAIFKSWFVDFAPFGGKMPQGWKMGKLGDVCNIYDSRRVPLSSLQRSKMQGTIPYYGATSIVDYVNDYLFDGIYLLMGEDGSVVNEKGLPFLQYVWGKFWPNNHAHVLEGKNGYSTEMLYCLLSQTKVERYVTGAVQPKISQSNMVTIPACVPDIAAGKRFTGTVQPLFDMIRNISQQSRALAALRDALLPKLMSGEIDVEKVKISA